METCLALLKGTLKDNIATVNSVPFTIGRCRTADFIIAHLNVSRNHCQIFRENQVWKIQDRSSSGTYVNEELVGKGESKNLNSGDVIRFGPPDSNLSWTFYSNVVSGDDYEEATESKKDIAKQLLYTSLSKTQGFTTKVQEYPLNDASLKSHQLQIKEIDSLSVKKSSFNKSEFGGESVCLTSGENRDQLTHEICQTTPNDLFLTTSTQNKDHIAISKTELKRQILEQEEERKKLLEKIKKMEEAQKALSQKLHEKENFSKHENFSVEKLLTQNKEIAPTQKIAQGIIENVVRQDNNIVSLELGYVGKDLSYEKVNENVDVEVKPNSLTFADVMEAELQCTICSELFVTAITLNCTHTFCRFCINQWKKKQKTCPICRKKITNETRSLVVDNYIDKVLETLSSDLKSRRKVLIAERNEVIPAKKTRSKKN